MRRKNAIRLIEQAISTGVWRTYVNPLRSKYMVHFPDTLVEIIQPAFPDDFMDCWEFIGEKVLQHATATSIELIHVPQHDNALMGQIEILVQEPVKVSLCIVFYKGAYWVQEKEFFPF